jgi:hypothetical protein
MPEKAEASTVKCKCGQPMRQHVIALDDIWWSCLICGRSKQAEPEPATSNNVRNTLKHEPDWAVEALAADPARRAKRDDKRRTEMSKTLGDLNDALHTQLERLLEAKLDGESLKTEIERSRATANLASQIIENGKLALEAQRCLGGKKGNPKMLGLAE